MKGEYDKENSNNRVSRTKHKQQSLLCNMQEFSMLNQKEALLCNRSSPVGNTVKHKLMKNMLPITK
jgi:hypothetical protein